MKFSNTKLIKILEFVEQGERGWFKVRYLSQEKLFELETDTKKFQWAVLDWGDNFLSPSGEDWSECNDENKEEFFREVPDWSARILLKACNIFEFVKGGQPEVDLKEAKELLRELLLLYDLQTKKSPSEDLLIN